MSRRTSEETVAEAARLFADGWGVTSRKYRMISRCPPEVDLAAEVKARRLPPLESDDLLRDFYRRCVSKESAVVSEGLIKALNALHGRGISEAARPAAERKAREHKERQAAQARRRRPQGPRKVRAERDRGGFV